MGILPQNRRKPEFNTGLGLDKHFVVSWKSDFLLSKVLLLSVENKEYELLDIVATAVREMREGELLQIEKASLAKNGEVITEEKEQALLSKIIDRYNKQTTPEYAASRLWVDEIIDPLDTRKWISAGIEMANNAPVAKYNVGVIQT